MADIIRMYKDKTSSATRTVSRYKKYMRIYDSDNNNYVETPDPILIKPSSGDRFHRVGVGEDCRLDIISFRYYGTPLLYWAIAEVNDITNPLKIEPGTVLRIPSQETLYGPGGILS